MFIVDNQYNTTMWWYGIFAQNYFRNCESFLSAPVPGIRRKGAIIGERYINKPLL